MGGRKSFWMFLLAGMFALGAAWFANTWMNDIYTSSQTADTEMDSVVVAAMDIAFSQKVRPVQLKLLQMPKGSAPSGSFRSIEEIKEKVALQTIYAGEILLDKKVRDHLGGSTLAAVIAPGKRAITVRVNDVIGVAGFLLPGNRVDVISTNRRGKKTTSRTLLQDIKVLAVDQTVSPDKDKPVIVRAVTLELTPREGERLVRATAEGTVQLALRNPMEQGIVEDEPEEEEPVKIAANIPAPNLSWITLIKGTSVEKTDVLP